MTSPISGTSLYTGTANGSTSTTGNESLGKDAFLKLLVAQLKYQDPSSPTDSSQFLAQTAQFTLVEKIEDLAKAESSILLAQQSQSALALVGRTVTFLDEQGASHTGTVSAVTFNEGVPSLRVGDAEVSPSSVTRVTA